MAPCLLLVELAQAVWAEQFIYHYSILATGEITVGAVFVYCFIYIFHKHGNFFYCL